MRLAVANREWHRLELLDLSDNGIEEIGGIIVAALICLGPNLLQCNLDWNSIRGRGATALGQALNNVPQSLRALSIDHNPLGDPGAAAIAEALVCVSSLRRAHLPDCRAGTTRSFASCPCATVASAMWGAPCLLTDSDATKRSCFSMQLTMHWGLSVAVVCCA